MRSRRAAPVPVTGIITDLQLGPADEYFVVLQVTRETFEALALPNTSATPKRRAS